MQDDFAPEDQQEDLDDIETAEKWFHGATLWSTDWTTETLLAQLQRRNVELNPRFQRRNAWQPKRKSLFIESLILGLPIPQLILAEDKNRRGAFIVIDGKQRLLSLRQFAAEEGDKDFARLKLVDLDERSDLNGLSYTDLKGDPKHADDLTAFDNQTIRTVVIRNWQNEAYLYSVFLRINTGSVQLSSQELRQALHPGPFSDFVDQFSIDSEPIKELLGLKEADFRMRDAELVLRYFAYKNFSGTYTGNLKQFLDGTTAKLNKNWEGNHDKVYAQAEDLNNAISFTKSIFGDKNYFRKWNGDKFERRINRAVFDIVVYYFSEPSVRELAKSRGDELVAVFKSLCEENSDFLSSLERTTKSLDANRTRFGVWARALSDVLGRKFLSPIPD
jgi:uncharacterized protein DUF262